MKAESGKTIRIVYEVACALAMIFFLVVQIKALYYVPGVLIVVLFLCAFLGPFLAFKKGLTGFIFLPGALILFLLTLPLVVAGLFLAGPYCWAFAALLFILGFIGFYIWGPIHGPGLALVIVTILPVALIGSFRSGAIDSGCDDLSEIVTTLGGNVLDLGASDLSCSLDAGKLIAALPDKGKVSLVSLGQGQTTDMEFSPGQPVEMGDGASLAYAYDSSKQVGYVIDTKTFVKYQNVDMTGFDCIPTSSVITELHLRTMMACEQHGRIEIIDTMRGVAVHTLERAVGYPSSLVANSQMDRVYVTDLFGSTVKEIDIETMGIIRNLSVGFSQSDAAVSADGTRVYFARPVSGLIDVYDAINAERKANFPAPLGVSRLAIDHEGNRLFAVAFATGELYVYDLSGTGKWRRIHLRARIRDMVYCPTSHLLYLSTFCDVFYLDPTRLLN